MALELDELLSRLTRLNQQKIESTEKMALTQDEIMHLNDMIVEREERHATEASTLATVIEEIEVGVRLTARQKSTRSRSTSDTCRSQTKQRGRQLT